MPSPREMIVYLFMLCARRQWFVTAQVLQKWPSRNDWLWVYTQTIKNWLHQVDFHSRTSVVLVSLSRHSCHTRLNWARQHSRWTVNQWQHVVFSDESRFCLDFNNGCQQVWRQAGEKFVDCAIAEHARHRGGSLMVWGWYPVTWTYRCAHLLFGDCECPEVFGWDHNSAHRQRKNTSPDLTEHAWDMLGRALHNIPVQFQTLVAMEITLCAQWMRIPQNVFNMLLASVRQAECTQATRGHPTTDNNKRHLEIP